MEDMEDTENTVSMVMAEATVMDGEIVISILINLMPYLINDDGEFRCFVFQQALKSLVTALH